MDRSNNPAETSPSSGEEQPIIPGEKPLETKLVVVLGMHRSGTSAVSNLLHANGVCFGSSLLAALKDNPQGFFEDKDIYELNEELLNALGYEWFSSAFIDPREQCLNVLEPFVERAAGLLRKKLHKQTAYGLKDPRFCKLLPFWKQVFSSLELAPVYVLMVRNPHDVALSLSRRHGFDAEKSMRIWLSHYLGILEDSEITGDSIAVDYDYLLDHVDIAAPRLIKSLKESGFALNSASIAVDTLDSSLRHGNRTPTSSSFSSHTTELCTTFYKLLSGVAENTVSKEDLMRNLVALKQEANDTKTLFDVEERAERLGAYHASSQHIDNMESKIADLGNQLIQLRSQLGTARNESGAARIELERVSTELVSMTHAKEQSLAEFHEYQEAVVHSVSWKLTSPMRLASDGCTAIFRRSRRIQEVVGRIGLYKTLQYAGKVFATEGITGIKNRARSLDLNSAQEKTYQQWVEEFDTVTGSSRERFVRAMQRLDHQPLISIVMPVFDPPVDLLIKAIESVSNQIYPNWELCIADDKSSNADIRDALVRCSDKDGRIKLTFRKENGHISRASNSALKMASGDFVALMDHDDLLPPHALFWVAQAINENPRGKLFYSDEDKIDLQDVRHDPYFKCDWNPDLFYSHNMFSHLGVYDAALLEEVGGFREGFEGSQDYDLALRCSEKIDFSQVIHIPRILYHWRVMPGSTALDASEKPYAMIAGERAINDHFQRTSIDAECKLLDFGYRVKYTIQGKPLVSVIIPTRDEVEVLRACLNSIRDKTTYDNYEIVIVDNGSERAETLAYLEEIQRDCVAKVVRDDGAFNFSRLNNKGVGVASGEIVALVNNDVEVVTSEWMTEMVSQASRPEIGAVGCRLIYPDNTLQHAGIILGLGGLAAYSHRCIPKDSPGYFGRAMLLQSMSAVTAACLFVRKKVYMEVNGLDADNLAVAYNDVDFCLRLREAGYRNIFTPYAELMHFESKSRGPEDTPEKQERLRKEYAYMRKRWGELLDRDPAYNPNLTLDREDFTLAPIPRVQHAL